MEKQYQIRKDAELVLSWGHKGKMEMSIGELAYLDQAIKTYDWSLESGDLSPAGCRKFLRSAVKKVTSMKRDPILN